MLIVLCLDVEEELVSVEALVRMAAVRGASVELLHVLDLRERDEFEEAMHPGLVRPRLASARSGAASGERAWLEEIGQRATPLLVGAGASQVSTAVLDGRPEREIVERLAIVHADLCAIGRRPDWSQSEMEGPRSVGRVARFVLDHAPCAVLLLR